MKGTTREQKLTVMAYLVDTLQDEEQHLTDDEDFVRQFLATPYDNPMTADEAKQMIRESHCFEEHIHHGKKVTIKRVK